MSLRENYGMVDLDWGSYPLGEHLDMGGCGADQGAAVADAADAARAAYAQKTQEERGGNNPYDFEECPSRLRYEIGTGCMNPACHCKNCHGSCACGSDGVLVEGFGLDTMFLGRDLKFWAVALLVAYVVYCMLNKKK